MESNVPDEIVASCDCGAGLRPAHDWYACPECGEEGILEV